MDILSLPPEILSQKHRSSPNPPAMDILSLPPEILSQKHRSSPNPPATDILSLPPEILSQKHRSSPNPPATGILSLPSEIFLIIALMMKVEDVAAFLQTSPDVSRQFSGLVNSMRSPANKTILMIAVTSRDYQLARILLEDGADPNLQDKDGIAAIHHAVWIHSDQLARILLKHGADPNLQDKDGMAAIHHAVQIHDDQIVSTLLTHQANPNLTDALGHAPLHYACRGELNSVIQLLVKNGGNINCRDKKGRTPLFYAASCDFSDVAALLLKLGAKTGIRDTNGCTAIHSAAFGASERVLVVLIGRGCMKSNVLDHSGHSPLHYAAHLGHHSTISLLISLGANPNIQNKWKSPPICSAAIVGNKLAVEALLPHVSNKGTYKGLVTAVNYGYAGIVRTFLEKSDEALFERIDFPLKLAVRIGHVDVARVILDFEFDLNFSPPLALAVRHHRTEIVKLLLESRYNCADASEVLASIPGTQMTKIKEMLQYYVN